jgi:VWFA-related protein
MDMWDLVHSLQTASGRPLASRSYVRFRPYFNFRISLQIALATLLLASPLASNAQTPPASPAQPTAATPASQQGKQPSDADDTGPLLRVVVRRVPIDVVVTDKQGNAVRGLQKSDFTITEDKAPQTILSFDYLDGSVASYTPAKLPPLPENTFVNLPSEPERGPLYILYYDMVNTPMADQSNIHKQLLDFVDHAQPGARFALFVNAAGLHLIQGFTSDHTLLRNAILSKGPGPHVPDVFMYGSNYGFQDAGAALQCLNFIAEYMSGIPGRKNLIWLSTYFPIPVAPGRVSSGQASGVAGGRMSVGPEFNDLSLLLQEEIKKTYSTMMRSQIALYPVDVEGQNAQSDPGDQVTKDQYEDEIAEATGGHAYYGSNSLQQLLDKAVDDGESYYTLSYDPTNDKYDGSERHVEVTFGDGKKSDYKLTYRTTYYAVADEDSQTPAKDAKPLKKDTQQARFLAAKAADTLYANIEHGAPVLHDLLFSVHLAAVGKPAMATAQQMSQLQDTPAYFRTRQKNNAQAKPPAPVPLQRYRIGYGIGATQLKLLANPEGKPAQLEFAAAAYDPDGRLLNSILNEGVASAGVDAGGKPLAFFHADQEIEVPPGAASLRMAVRDTRTNRTGTFEVPLPLKPETASSAKTK